MSRISLTEELRAEYHRLFTTCVIRSDKTDEIEALTDAIVADRKRYQQVAAALGIPWFVVGALHTLETDRDFSCHLHNGDPLTERTRHLPDGRPQTGEPPFSWEESAIDALQLHHLDQCQDWSIAGTLFCLEDYNSWNYRLHHPEVPSPYLWNYSTQ
ncbi:MAG: peptidoglycan-binding protein [Candidatus Competibacteraceae bacterium]